MPPMRLSRPGITIAPLFVGTLFSLYRAAVLSCFVETLALIPLSLRLEPVSMRFYVMAPLNLAVSGLRPPVGTFGIIAAVAVAAVMIAMIMAAVPTVRSVVRGIERAG